MDQVVCWAIYCLEKQHRGERALMPSGVDGIIQALVKHMKTCSSSGTLRGPGEPRMEVVVSLGKRQSQKDTAGDVP